MMRVPARRGRFFDARLATVFFPPFFAPFLAPFLAPLCALFFLLAFLVLFFFRVAMG